MGPGWVLGFALVVGSIPALIAYAWRTADRPLDFSALATAHDALARIWRKEQDAHDEMKERW